MPRSCNQSDRRFLSTPSARRATCGRERRGTGREISIHALREEGDVDIVFITCRSYNFYPRPPRGGRHNLDLKAAEGKTISIHALREEGDARPGPYLLGAENFYPRPPRGGRPHVIGQHQAVSKISIHALREEGDQHIERQKPKHHGFLSTPSARRATGGVRLKDPGGVFLSTPSARRATYTAFNTVFNKAFISIHALREEGDRLPVVRRSG